MLITLNILIILVIKIIYPQGIYNPTYFVPWSFSLVQAAWQEGSGYKLNPKPYLT